MNGGRRPAPRPQKGGNRSALPWGPSRWARLLGVPSLSGRNWQLHPGLGGGAVGGSSSSAPSPRPEAALADGRPWRGRRSSGGHGSGCPRTKRPDKGATNTCRSWRGRCFSLGAAAAANCHGHQVTGTRRRGGAGGAGRVHMGALATHGRTGRGKGRSRGGPGSQRNRCGGPGGQRSTARLRE